MIEGWQYSWRYGVNWYAGVAFGLLAAWNMMPKRVSQEMPDWVDLGIGAVLFAGHFIVRAIAQPKTRAKIEAKVAEKSNVAV